MTNSQCEILSTDIDEQTTAAIVVYARQYAEPVHKFLAMENVNQIRLPQDFQDMPLDVAYETIRVRRKELPAELDKIRTELDEMSRKWFLKLTTARDVMVDRIDEIASIPQFGRTDYAFMIDGWVPVADVDALTGMLHEKFGNEIIVSQLEIDEKDFENAPVALQNAGWARPYEELMGVMGKPKYGTYDPTWMLAIFYPLFFGMIVGDIGYGLVMLGTVIWLRMKFKDNSGVQLATAILGPAATSVIIFGFIYGEFFGNLLGPGVRKRHRAAVDVSRLAPPGVPGTGGSAAAAAVRAHTAGVPHHLPGHRHRHRRLPGPAGTRARRLQRHQDQALVPRV